MTANKDASISPNGGVKQFLFGDQDDSTTGVDVAIVLFLIVFLFASTLSIAVMNIGYAAATILWFGRMAYRRRNEIPRTPLDAYLLAFVGASLLSLLFSYNKSQSLLYIYRRVSLLPIIFVLLANIRSTRMLKLLFGTLLTSMLFVALWSLRDIVLHFPEYLLFQRRLREFQMYMTAGGMMMFGMLLLLPFAVHPKTPAKIRWLAFVSLIPIGANLLFTFTRSSWLGFLAGAIVIGWFRAKKIFVPLILIVLAVVTFSSPEMRERMSSIFDPSHPTNVSRVRMWETGLKMFKDHPLVGVGDIGIEQVWPQYAPPENEPVGHLHNNMMMWLVTLGSIGLIVMVALFAILWVVAMKIEKRLHANWFLGSVALGCLATMAGFHVNGLFEWNFGDAEIIMIVWAITGMTFAADNIAPAEDAIG